MISDNLSISNMHEFKRNNLPSRTLKNITHPELSENL